MRKAFHKKLFIFISFIFTFLFNFYGASLKGNEKVVIIPSVDNLSNENESWIGDVVAERIESILSKYSDFVFVNRANKIKIAELQKESENAIYDENTAIEIGRLTNASYGLFVDIKYTGTGYSIGARFTDLTTGINLATVMPVFTSSLDNIAGYYGCAADEITISLCDALGIRLTQTQKHIIMNGEAGLNLSEKTAMYNESEQRYVQHIKELNKEINTISKDTSPDAVTRQKKLEADRKFAEEKLEWVRAKQEKLNAEERKRQNDEILNNERSEVQREKITETSIKLAEKMDEIRAKYIGTNSILSQIKYVETIKSSYVEINDMINDEAERVNNEIEKEIRGKTEEIMNETPRHSEMSNGVMTKEAVNNRLTRIDDFAFSKRSEAEYYVENLKKTVSGEKKKIIRNIEKEYKKFGKRNISTLSDELVVYFGDYDGTKKGWPLNVIVQSDDNLIFQTTSFLPYETLTGNRPVTDFREPGFDDYNDEVDFYVSMFSRGEPILLFDLDVIIYPLDKEHPSEYEFTFEKFGFYKTLKANVNSRGISSFGKERLELDSDYTVKQMIPAYDIHTDEEIEEQERQAEEMREQAAYERIMYEEQQRKEAEREEKKRVRAEKKNFKRSLIGLNAGTMFTGGKGYYAGLEFSKGLLPFFYFTYKIDLYSYNQYSSSFYSATDPEYNPVLGNMFQLGINMPLGSLEVFCSAGAGFNWCVPMAVIRADMTFDEKADAIGQHSYFDFTYGITAGISYELFSHFALTGSYSLAIIHDTEYKFDNLNFGIAFVF